MPKPDEVKITTHGQGQISLTRVVGMDLLISDYGTFRLRLTPQTRAALIEYLQHIPTETEEASDVEA